MRSGQSRRQYFVPIFEWLPKNNLKLFPYDLLAGITITSLAIPQGISYAKLGDIPSIIGLYSSFVPPIIYAIFGSTEHIAIGNRKCRRTLTPYLYLKLVFTATLFTGIYQAVLGFLSGTATIISLQQLKGMFGATHFTTKTDVISVLQAVFKHRDEWRWESAVVGLVFQAFLVFTRYLKKRNSKLFWVSAIAPMVTVVIGGLFAYLAHAEKHGIQIVITLKAGLITGTLALAEGIAIGRSFAILRNYRTDGNKEMVAFGMMNIVGSLTSCYLTTVIQLVALSAIIMDAMFGLIEYEEAYSLFKVDEFDFCICMAALVGVAFIGMDVGLLMSVSLAILRSLLYVARPATCKLGSLPDSGLYCDIKQYPLATGIPGILILKLGSPIYFANCSYLKERDEAEISDSKVNEVEHLLLDIGGRIILPSLTGPAITVLCNYSS
ncbi:hypothetical protein ACJRO7_016333 [Eucalyptus globulus]|uniref:STAS domain-containing protein n=1 Tax=Eucalyptus globulus TaxID=34317 RepID=A0ABD3LGV5_EUCGL